MRADKIISEEDWEHAKYRLDETIAEVARYRNEEAAAEADLRRPTCNWSSRASWRRFREWWAAVPYAPRRR